MADWIAKGIVTAFKLAGITLEVSGPWVRFAANFLQAVASSALMSALSGKGGGPTPGANYQVSFDPKKPRSAILGRYVTAGSLAGWANSTTGENPNDKIVIILPVADHKCAGLAGGWHNGRRLSFDVAQANGAGRAPLDLFTRAGDEFGWVTFHDGDWNQDACANLVAWSGGEYTEADRGRGVAYVELEFLYPDDDGDRHELFPGDVIGNFFQFVWEVDGYIPYDRRFDGTAGGTGDQRLDDTATWSFDSGANSAVLIENLLLGLRVEDESDPDTENRARDIFYGCKLEIGDLPFDEQVSAMNSCDEDIDLLGGGTEPRYRAAGEIDCAQPIETPLKDLTASMAGGVVYGAGRWYCWAGVARTAVNEGDPVLDGHRRLDGDYSCTDFTPLTDLVTSVTANYSDPSQIYRLVDAPIRTSAAAVAAIDDDQAIDLGLRMVTSATQVQRLMEIALRLEQYQWREEIPLGPNPWLGAEPGPDWIERYSPRYGTLTFQVQAATPGVGDDDILMAKLSLRQISADAFDWSADDEDASGGLLDGALATYTETGTWTHTFTEDLADGAKIRLTAGGGTAGVGEEVYVEKSPVFVPGAGGGGGQVCELSVAGPITAGTVWTGSIGAGGDVSFDGGNTTCTTLSLTAHGGLGSIGGVPGDGGTGATGGDFEDDGRDGGMTNVSDGGGSGDGGADQTGLSLAGHFPGGGGSADGGFGRGGAVQIFAL